MTGTQWLSLLGGIAQGGALVWAWIALYRLSLVLWRDRPPVQWVVRTGRWLVTTRARVVGWFVRRPPIHGRLEATVPAVSWATGSAGHVITSDGTVEGRLAALERSTQLRYEKQAGQIADLRKALDREVTTLRDEHREAREAADAVEWRMVRLNLGGPAFLAIVGTILQTWAAFAPSA